MYRPFPIHTSPHQEEISYDLMTDEKEVQGQYVDQVAWLSGANKVYCYFIINSARGDSEK